MTLPYRAYLRAPNYHLLGEIDDWEAIDIHQRRNGVGTWAMETPSTSWIVPYLEQGAGIVVTRLGIPIFSGAAVSEIRRTVNTVSLAGTDDNVLLEEPARPTPSQASGPYPDAYWVLTGQASGVIATLVNENIGPAAPAGCKVAAIISTADPAIGGTVTGRAYFEPLISVARRLAATPAAGGINFRMIQSPSHPGRLEFVQALAVDRSLTAKFGVNLNTAEDFEDIQTFPDVNYWVVLGGDGFGTNRTVVEGGDAAAIAAAGRRITGVHDARGITDLGELNQKLAELLAGTISLRRTTIVPFESLVYGVDWDLGDVVTVVVNGVARAEVIQGVHLQFTRDRGVIVTPTIGAAAATDDDTVVQHLKSTMERVSNLELMWNIPPKGVDLSMMADAQKDAVAATPSLRTLGTGAQQAAAGNHGHTTDAAAGTGSFRTLGTGAQQAAAGNHTHANMARIYTGTYTGDGVSSRAITGLPFTPLFVVIQRTSGTTEMFFLMNHDGFGLNPGNYPFTITGNTFSSNQFTVTSLAGTNTTSATYSYTAFG